MVEGRARELALAEESCDEEGTALRGSTSESSEDSLTSAEARVVDSDNITGLEVPPVFHIGHAYCHVTTGWLGICVATLFIQITVVLIMLKYSADEGEGCLCQPMSLGQQVVLRSSKAFGVTVAGFLMGKDFMDTVNYWMVSILLEGRNNVEVVISAISRLLLTLLIGVANVAIFINLLSPASVWINMTALGFIGELGSGVLEVARRGVFGHHISKVMTNLNFQLTFQSEYPKWFTRVRGLALLIMTGFLLFCAGLLFILPEPLCPAAEDCLEEGGGGSATAAAPGGGGGGGGGGGHHG